VLQHSIIDVFSHSSRTGSSHGGRAGRCAERLQSELPCCASSQEWPPTRWPTAVTSSASREPCTSIPDPSCTLLHWPAGARAQDAQHGAACARAHVACPYRTLGATDAFFDAAATTAAYPFHEIEPKAYQQAFEGQLLCATARGTQQAAILQVCASAEDGSNQHCYAASVRTPLHGCVPKPWRAQVDAGSCILRGKLGCMLDAILGRPAKRAELSAWFTVRVCGEPWRWPAHCWHARWPRVALSSSGSCARARRTAACWRTHTHTHCPAPRTTQFLDFDRSCVMSRGEYDTAVAQLREWSASPQRARQYASFSRWREDRKQHRRVEWSPQRALQEPLTAAQTVRLQLGRVCLWAVSREQARAACRLQCARPHTPLGVCAAVAACAGGLARAQAPPAAARITLHAASH
jgi:hypothetical protein